MYQYKDDSFMLHNDLYQINMAESYWFDGIHERKAVFDLTSEICLLEAVMPYSMVYNV